MKPELLYDVSLVDVPLIKQTEMIEALVQELSHYQIQDGGHIHHIGNRIALNIERNLPLTTPLLVLELSSGTRIVFQ